MLQEQTILHIAIFTAILMVIIDGMISYSERAIRYYHTFEFWLCYLFYFLVSFLTQGLDPLIVASSTLIWIWRTNTVAKILSDVVGVPLKKNWYRPFLVLSYIVGFILWYFDFSFMIFTLPGAISNFVVAIDLIEATKKNIKSKDRVSPAHYLLLLNVFLIYIHSLDYPFLRSLPEFSKYGFAIALLTTILMAIILPAVTIYELQRDQQEGLEKIIKDRVGQLTEQSKFASLGIMTAGIVHEIKSPLSVIGHRTSLLKQQLKKEHMDLNLILKNVDQIEITADRMTKIVNGLRSFSRNSENEVFQIVPLAPIIEDTLSFCSDRFYHANIIFHIEPLPALEIECRPIQLSQVFLNLLNNSFDAVKNSANPWVKIDFLIKEKSIQIRIVDSGTGIPANIRKKIMDPFFSTSKEGGTGLGLSISKGIIEGHKGKLYYNDSSLNTMFVLELPYRQNSA